MAFPQAFIGEAINTFNADLEISNHHSLVDSVGVFKELNGLVDHN